MVTQYLEPTSNLSRGTNRYANRLRDAEHGRGSGGVRVGGCWHCINSSTCGRDPAPPGGTSIGWVDRDIAPCIDSPISPTSVRPDRTSDCCVPEKFFEKLRNRFQDTLQTKSDASPSRSTWWHPPSRRGIRTPPPTPSRFVTPSNSL